MQFAASSLLLGRSSEFLWWLDSMLDYLCFDPVLKAQGSCESDYSTGSAEPPPVNGIAVSFMDRSK